MKGDPPHERRPGYLNNVHWPAVDPTTGAFTSATAPTPVCKYSTKTASFWIRGSSARARRSIFTESTWAPTVSSGPPTRAPRPLPLFVGNLRHLHGLYVGSPRLRT